MPDSPNATSLFLERLAEYRALVTPRLAAALGGQEPRDFLYDLIGEHLSRAGKGLRPALCIATAAAFGAERRKAVPSASALEMLHNAFLVHDDIEDESEFRRNGPTLHRAHGIPLAINAGDAMQVLGLRILRDNVELLGGPLAFRILDEFDHLLSRSLEGQAMELGWIRTNQWISEDDYLRLVLKKTCWYSFIHPCRIGALIAQGEQTDLARFDAFGFLLGAAFQIWDDVLNLVGERIDYGKEIDGDLWEGKRTLLLAHLFQTLTQPEAKRAQDIFSKARGERDGRDVEWLHALLRDKGSIAYAQQTARELAAAALGEFERAFADAPDGLDRAFVRSLVDFAVSRTR